MNIKAGAYLPIDTDIEETVIGAMIVDNASLEYVSQRLQPDDFWSEEAGAIFKACISLKDRNLEVNKGSVAKELEALGQFGDSINENYLDGVINAADVFFLEDNVKELLQLSALRMVVHICSKGQKVVMQPKADAVALIRDLLANIGALAARLVDIDPATLRPIAISQMQAIRHEQDQLEENLQDIHNLLLDIKYAVEASHYEEKPKPKRKSRKAKGTKPTLEAQL